MRLPYVAHQGPGVAAAGFTVRPDSGPWIHVQPVDLALLNIPSPWGSLVLASTTRLPLLTLALCSDASVLWIIRAPLLVVRDHLRTDRIPVDWRPPFLPRPTGVPA